MKLWQKNTQVSQLVEKFTVGKDREFDIQLAPFDVLGSLAHVNMLFSIHLLTEQEYKSIEKELKNIYREIETGNFTIDEQVEDIHSQIELLLTQRIGEAGKKIHSGRSRNDQVLVDLKLFFRNEIEILTQNITHFFELLSSLSEQHQHVLMPGYTHMQIAMPSSFGLWFGAYAESLVDDLEMLLAAYRICNKNPLGSAAGYGSSFPLNRTLTTELLGFETLNYNVVYAQMSRGKTERCLAQALASVAGTLAKLSIDVCLFMGQNFGFFSFPDELTTGSSIMPHKKNPDVFELIRGKCNAVMSIPNELTMMTNNLPSGYHRDLQLLKESLFPAFKTVNDCIELASLMLNNIKLNTNILSDAKYDYLFSVEEVNRLVLEGVPFREAYKQVGIAIEAGKFTPPKNLHHTHEGSIGNICHAEIKQLFNEVLQKFSFEKVHRQLNKLVE